MGPLSVPALGAPCQVWGQQGWRCLQGVLPWLPPPFPLSLQFLHGLSVCLAVFGTPSSCRRGGRCGQNSPGTCSIPWDQWGGPVSPQGSGHPTLSTCGDALTSCGPCTGRAPLAAVLPLCLCGQQYLGFLGFPGIPYPTPFPAFRPPQGAQPLCPWT